MVGPSWVLDAMERNGADERGIVGSNWTSEWREGTVTYPGIAPGNVLQRRHGDDAHQMSSTERETEYKDTGKHCSPGLQGSSAGSAGYED